MPLTVLIVDDTRFTRRKLSDMVKSVYPDTVITEAEDGQQALDEIAKTKFDLMLLDLNMPVFNGFQTLERLQQAKSTLPVVVLSANIQDKAVERTLSLGAMDFMGKPPEMEKLKRILESIVAK